MRGRINNAEIDQDQEQYRFTDAIESLKPTKRRLDLNDLLKRAKEEEKNNNKTNLIIFSGAATVIGVFILIISI